MTARQSGEIDAELLPILRYEPSPKQEAFYRSTHKRRLVRAGNQVGKTKMCADEAWCLALGAHPYKDVAPAPTRGLVIAADWRSYVDVVGRALFDSCPEWALEDSDYDDKRGWRNNRIRLKNGSVILFRWGGSQSTAIAGLVMDWVWIDEPPPRRLFSEAMTRVAKKGGPAFLSMTPIGRPVDWLREHVEGDEKKGIEPREEWQQIVITLTVEDCPHRTQEDIDAQLAGCLPSEMPQRRDGAWEGAVTDRAIETFTPSHVVDWDLDQMGTCHIGLSADHGEKTARQTALAAAWNDDCILIFDENASTKPTNVEDDAEEIRQMLAVHGLAPEQVDLAVGDINSAGKLARSRSVNEELGRALGIDFEPANKLKVSDHVYEANQAFLSGRLFIHERCTGLIRCVNNWKHERRYEDLKHFMDAMFYLVTKVRRQHFKGAGAPSQIIVRK